LLEELLLRCQRITPVPVQKEDQFYRLVLSLIRHEDMVRAWIIGFLSPTLLEESNSCGEVFCSLDAKSPDVEQTSQEEALDLFSVIQTHHAFHASKVSVIKASV